MTTASAKFGDFVPSGALLIVNLSDPVELLFGAVVGQVWRGHVGVYHYGGSKAAESRAAQLFVQDHAVHSVQLKAAVLFGVAHTQKAELARREAELAEKQADDPPTDDT